MEMALESGYTLTILGCGTMGTAVLQSILDSKFEPYPGKIICCTSSEASSLRLQKTYGDSIVTGYGDAFNQGAVSTSDVIILGCKPFLCSAIMKTVENELNGEQVIISLLAGWTIDQLKQYSPYIARVMTNTPAKFGYGMACISFSDAIDAAQEKFVLDMINPIGKAIKIPEKNMDAATALVGSGPAFVLLMLEAMTEGGVKMGIPYAIAQECAIKVMEGTAKMCEITGEHPALLKSKVCTPGGTTIGGLMVMEDKGVRSGIARAIEEASNIATNLGKK